MAKTVMIVDDSASLRQVVSIALRSAGYEVVEASNGQEALNKMACQRMNLVISDVNMPLMDGLTFVREMKKHPAHRFTPVVMLTTEEDESKKRAGQEAGARAWVVKPFAPQQMLTVVSRLIM